MCNSKEVSCSNLFNLSMCCRIKVNTVCKAPLNSYFVWQKACCVVSSNLCCTCSVWCRSVVIFSNHEVYRSHSTLEVRSNRASKHSE